MMIYRGRKRIISLIALLVLTGEHDPKTGAEIGAAGFAIWFMVFLSLVSAIDYFAAFWSKIDRRVVKRRRRAFILSRRRKRDVPVT